MSLNHICNDLSIQSSFLLKISPTGGNLSALKKASIPNAVKIIISHARLTALLDVHETGVPAERLLLLAPFRAAILEPHL